MTCLPVRLALGLAAFVLVLPMTSARADDPCIGDAKEQFSDCKGQCKEDFQLAKDNCLNRDHDCVEVCRAAREECRIASGIDAALDACRDTLRDAKATCRANNPPDSTELDHCIDQAQVVAFICRRDARLAAKPALTACRAGFRACARACPPPATPSEGIDRAQCQVDAKSAYVACKAGCREDFQVQIDACKNRDHDCVEGCRAARDTCRQPIEDTLDSDIAACNTQRDSDVATCKTLFADGTPEQENCIEQAQVDAFECRDQARENARPGFLACRDQFKTCVTSCPPAS